MIPVISRDKTFVYECLTICENCKHNVFFFYLGKCFCGVKEPVGVGVGFKLIKWAPPFAPGGRSAQEKNSLILKLLPLANPKGHVANAFWKEREITAGIQFLSVTFC